LSIGHWYFLICLVFKLKGVALIVVSLFTFVHSTLLGRSTLWKFECHNKTNKSFEVEPELHIFLKTVL
jgi:hypothetical protein